MMHGVGIYWHPWAVAVMAVRDEPEQVQGRCRLASFRPAEASNSTPDTCIIMSNLFLAPALLGRCVYRLQPTGRTNSSYPGPATTTTARARAALQKSVARPPRAQHVVTGDGDEKEGVWASGDGDWRERGEAKSDGGQFETRPAAFCYHRR